MTGSVAIVTGAGQGIGHATAKRLARDFKSVVLVARNRVNLQQTAVAVTAAGSATLIIETDLAQGSSAKLVVERALSVFGRTINAAIVALAKAFCFEWTEAK